MLGVLCIDEGINRKENPLQKLQPAHGFSPTLNQETLLLTIGFVIVLYFFKICIHHIVVGCR